MNAGGTLRATKSISTLPGTVAGICLKSPFTISSGVLGAFESCGPKCKFQFLPLNDIMNTKLELFINRLLIRLFQELMIQNNKTITEIARFSGVKSKGLMVLR